jgi:hypothetical protein
VQQTIYTRDELVLEARPEGRYILLRREGEHGSVRVYLNEVRYLVDGMWARSAGVTGSPVAHRWTVWWGLANAEPHLARPTCKPSDVPFPRPVERLAGQQ